MSETTCESIQTQSDLEVWNYYEGNLDKARREIIKSHCLWCEPCLYFYAEVTQRIRAADPKRYSRFHEEVMAVRRAELLRFCREAGHEIDVSKIKEPEDYFKIAIGTLLGGGSEEFYDTWNKLDHESRDRLVLGALRVLAAAQEEDEEY